jgi:Flp pilus assembly protein TadD
MKRFLAILWAGTAVSVFGCIWDARTLKHEKKANPDLASVILNAGKKKPIDPAIRKDIERLRGRPEPENVEWINNLAGAYLRVGEPAEAVKLLEPARERFPNDYGVRANLGTAYHLLGRYAEAEREIAKDLELNPNAHFGLEKYHLALLQ